jgi:glycerophosphoryl diester phosphodiesterase
MQPIKIDNKNCKMVAHRGVSGVEKENTCPAFVTAGTRSYYGIETDVHVTKDGKYIIIHDDTTTRVTGVEYTVEQTDFDVLRSIKVLDTDGVTTRSDLILHTLDDYTNICKKHDKVSVLELKNTMEEKHLIGIVERIKELGWYEKTIFITFSQENVVLLRKNYADAKIQFLYCEKKDEYLDFMIENKVDADVWYGAVDKEYVDLLHANGIEINCWTVDREEDAKRLIDAGVDYITSNILE